MDSRHKSPSHRQPNPEDVLRHMGFQAVDSSRRRRERAYATLIALAVLPYILLVLALFWAGVAKAQTTDLELERFLKTCGLKITTYSTILEHELKNETPFTSAETQEMIGYAMEKYREHPEAFNKWIQLPSVRATCLMIWIDTVPTQLRLLNQGTKTR